MPTSTIYLGDNRYTHQFAGIGCYCLNYCCCTDHQDTDPCRRWVGLPDDHRPRPRYQLLDKTVSQRSYTLFKSLTHQVLVVIIIRIIDDPHAILLVVPAETTRPVPFAINSRPALKTDLPQALVEALAQRASRDLRVELPAQSAVAVTLEGRVRSSTTGE